MQVENQRGVFIGKEDPAFPIAISGRQEYSSEHPKRVDFWVVRAPDQSEKVFATYRLVVGYLAENYCDGDVTLVKVEWLKA